MLCLIVFLAPSTDGMDKPGAREREAFLELPLIKRWLFDKMLLL
jgi:hypothetical protein